MARVARVELEQAEMKASLMHLPSKFDDFASEMRAALHKLAATPQVPVVAPPQVDHFSLALQHLAAAIERKSASNPILLALAIVGVVAIVAGFGFIVLRMM